MWSLLSSWLFIQLVHIFFVLDALSLPTLLHLTLWPHVAFSCFSLFIVPFLTALLCCRPWQVCHRVLPSSFRTVVPWAASPQHDVVVLSCFVSLFDPLFSWYSFWFCATHGILSTSDFTFFRPYRATFRCNPSGARGSYYFYRHHYFGRATSLLSHCWTFCPRCSPLRLASRSWPSRLGIVSELAEPCWWTVLTRYRRSSNGCRPSRSKPLLRPGWQWTKRFSHFSGWSLTPYVRFSICSSVLWPPRWSSVCPWDAP